MEFPVNRIKSKNLVVILKTTETCNLNCKYCYFFNGGYQNHKNHPQIIPEDVIKDISTFLKQGAYNLNLKSIRINIHGGEPLLQKKTDFDWMCSFFNKELSPILKTEFSIQTNATLIDDEWIQLFLKHNIGVGFSLDGPPDYNDENRIYKNGRGSHCKIKKNIFKLQQAIKEKRLNSEIGVLCVVNPERDAKKIYRHFVDDLHLKRMDFVLPDLTWESFNEVSSERYGYFLSEVFDEWMKDNNPEIYVRILEAVLRTIGGRPSSLIGIGPNSTLNPLVITIASNGDLSPEEAVAHTNPEAFMNIANVKDITLKGFIDLPIIMKIEEEKNTTPFKCRSCCWENVCKGGADHHRYKSGNGLLTHSVMCEGLKKIYSHVATYLLKNGYPADELNKTLFNSGAAQ